MDILQVVISELGLNGWTMFCVWERIIKLSQFINTLGHVNNALQEDLLGEITFVSFWFSAGAIISHVLTFISKQLTFFSVLPRCLQKSVGLRLVSPLKFSPCTEKGSILHASHHTRN